MRQIAMEIAYDGSQFSGWQIQPNAVTVQGVIEKSLGQILKTRTVLWAAGRTDTGVHAIGQIASFRTSSRMTVRQFKEALNSVLPERIRILNAYEVSPEFHPRYSAKKRWYRYIISTAPILMPFFFNYVLWVKRSVDTALLNQYCSRIIGMHDFRSFASLGTDEVPYREVYECECTKKDDFVLIDITANAFLRKMIRTLIGTFLELEKKKKDPGRVEEILEMHAREEAGSTACPAGLYLVKVFY
jgi:tRNA pseudouridine38-40 synthase